MRSAEPRQRANDAARLRASFSDRLTRSVARSALPVGIRYTQSGTLQGVRSAEATFLSGAQLQWKRRENN